MKGQHQRHASPADHRAHTVEQSAAIDEQGIARCVQARIFEGTVIQRIKAVDSAVMEQEFAPAVFAGRSSSD